MNIDDENTEALLEGHICKLVTYGRSEKADYRAEGCELLRTHDFLGVAFHVSGRDNMDVRVNMPGEFSVYNALAALAVGKVLGLPDAAIHEGLGKCVVKGRVELVPISKKFTILLDYAHNEVSTESLLTTLRAYHPHRLVVQGIAGLMNGSAGFPPELFYFGLLTGATLGGNLTPIGASANIAAIGILRKQGEQVRTRDFLRIGIPFTLAAVLTGYVYLWLVCGA